MVEVKDLFKRYGKRTILNKVSFQMDSAEIVAILGPSGSGKSTFIRCLGGLEPICGGTIALSAPTGFVFQGYNLFPHLTILKNLTYAPVRNQFLTEHQSLLKAQNLLQEFGLTCEPNSYPHTLSGGEKQRVAILRALMMEPKLILFDEPTSALDPDRTELFLKMVKKMAQKGTSSLLVTHERSLAQSLADRILYLNEGSFTRA